MSRKSWTSAGSVLCAVGALVALTGAASGAELAIVEGRITSAESGEPLPYANVQLVGTRHGAIGRDDGTFRIEGLAPGAVRLRVTYIGYAARIEEIVLAAGSTVRPALSWSRPASREKTGCRSATPACWRRSRTTTA